MTRRKSPPTRKKKAAPRSARSASPEPATRDEPDDLPDDPVEERAEPGEGALVPIVGVGASAGGLEAFTRLLQALPADTGMAFVLVQHLAPSHASALAEILSRATTMPVTEVHDEPTVEPNHVYVIPPGQSMVISGGTLNLLPREGRGAHHPVDLFFRALAEDRRHRAIGVVLSGTATDGTIGLEAIKAEGGITFAQDDTAQHQGMPQSAIASGSVDFVLPPNEIAREIVRIGRHPYSVPETQDAAPGGEPDLNPIIQQVRRATGVDFTHYKFNTLNRRVTRRMLLRKVETLEDYVGLLQRNPAEVEALYHDVLINVTSFFRNPEAFEALKQNVLPRLIKDRSRNDPVRFWTLGCSTGQEAYSLAMAFAESVEAAGSAAPLLVFATDLDEGSVETARLGVYSKDIAQDVSPERLRRFFVEVEGHYRIIKSIRDLCVFSRHNALTDPPFSRMDLISCRNLLIYLEPVLQQRIVPTLHYALKPAGFLWLGGSETIGGYRHLFEAEDARHKIYVKKPGTAGARFPLQHGGAPRAGFTPIVARPSRGEGPHREADRLLLSKFAPPSVLVTADLDILQYRGDTGPYLAPAPGKASLNLLKMLREGLLVGIRAAIVRAGKEQAPVRKEGLTVKSNGGHREIAVEVIPIKGDDGQQAGSKGGGFLVLFDESAGAIGPRSVRPAGTPPSPPPGDDQDIARLAQDLAATREYLQSVIEQQEAANEELQSANEEAQSANEELQSVNEELETSKEELQSSNEELATVNDELNNRNLELGRLSNDLVNLIGSVQMPIVMFGPDLRIRRFTPAAEKVLNLVPADVGRPVGAIRLDFDLPDLEPLLAEVMDTVSTREREVRDKHGHWYALRLSPYRTLDNKIDGVVLVLVDVDAIKRAHEYTASIVATVRQPLLVLDADLRVRTANDAYYRTFGMKPEGTEGSLIYEVGNGQWSIPELRRNLEQVLPRDDGFSDYEVEQEFEHVGRKTMLLSARRLLQPGDRSPSILLAIEDVTGRKAAEVATARLAAIVDSSNDAIVSKNLDGVITSWNRGAERLFGYSPEETIGKPETLLTRPDDVDEEPRFLEQIRRGEVIGHHETVRRRKDGSLVDVSLTVSPLRDAAGRVVGASSIAHDITERRRAREELRRHTARFETLLDEAPIGVYLVDGDFRIRHVNALAFQVFGDIPALIGRDFDEVIHLLWPKAFADEVVRLFRHTLETGDPYSCPELIEQRVDRRVTEYYQWQINRIPLPDRGYGVVCYFREISEQVKSRAAIAESAHRLRFVMDSAPQKIFTATPSGAVDYFNPQWTEFTGLSFEQIRDWGWTQFIHPEDVEENVRVWRHSIDTGEPFQFEHRFWRKDGAYRWHLSRAVALKDAGGQVLMWVGSATDIHEQKETGDKLRQYATDLSEADRRKNEFLAMLAHELRNPLAPIRNALRIIQLSGDDRRAVQSASEMMERQVGQMVRLVDDLVDVSRVSRGRIELRRGRVELASVVNRAADATRALCETMDQELTVTLPPRAVYLNADPTRLAQVVGNLLNNACKFTERGGRIWLTAEREDGQAVIRVRDNGVGIAARDLPLIFDIFMQVDTTLERSVSGLGLGLTLAKNLVELHGGTVEARSDGPGQGSEFVVRLPLLDEAPKAPSEPATGEPTPVTLRRILVVDDSRDSAASLGMLLELDGHDVQTAYDGLEAVAAAAAFRPDVILLDIGLPKLNGYEVARKIREQPWGKGMVLVALTGWGQDEDRRKSKDAGFDRHVVKPLGHSALTKLLASLSSSRSPAD